MGLSFVRTNSSIGSGGKRTGWGGGKKTIGDGTRDNDKRLAGAEGPYLGHYLGSS